MLATTLLPYPNWLHSGDNAWQMTAATFVGLMSVPGLVVLYGGVMQKRWSVNSMMLTFIGLRAWCWSLGCCGRSRWASAARSHLFGIEHRVFFETLVGNARQRARATSASRHRRTSRCSTAVIPKFRFPEASLVYFQFVFAAITPILMLGSVLGRINFKAWIPFVLLWITFVLRGQRVPDLGRRLLRRARRAGLLRWLRDPPRGRRLRLRRGVR